jgi:hypothetical protein
MVEQRLATSAGWIQGHYLYLRNSVQPLYEFFDPNLVRRGGGPRYF